MSIPTNSEIELADRDCIETLRVSAAATTADGAIGEGKTFTIRRQHGIAETTQFADLTTTPTLLIESSINWRDLDGAHERTMRTVICRAGLTQCGVVGSLLGRPVAGPEPPAPE
ncbi:MAG: hypothetical protein ABI680_14315 [Chthoniobacteraceae bacterium]